MSGTIIRPGAGRDYIANPIFNALIPAEGPKTVPLVVPFSSGQAPFLVDFTLAFQQKKIEVIQSAWIDNTASGTAFTINVVGNDQTLNIPPFAQGMFPLLAGQLPKFIINGLGTIDVPIVFLNVPMPYVVWSPSGTGSSVIVTNTVSVVAVGGTLDVNVLGTVPVSGTVALSGVGTIPVTGTVDIGNIPTVDVAGTVPVSGTIGISGTVPVTGTFAGTITGGTVDIGNIVSVDVLGTVPVSGTVGVSGTVPVSGTVSVGNTVTVNINSGTVAVSGTVPVSGTVGVSGTVPISGTVTANDIPPVESFVAGSAISVATGGTAVTVFAAGVIQTGAWITNPQAATESLFVDPINAATTVEGHLGTNFVLAPGQTMQFGRAAGAITANAVTSGHTFDAVRF